MTTDHRRVDVHMAQEVLLDDAGFIREIVERVLHRGKSAPGGARSGTQSLAACHIIHPVAYLFSTTTSRVDFV
jgi:hypothetical protein